MGTYVHMFRPDAQFLQFHMAILLVRKASGYIW
jgi:hypothetical protein